MNVAKSDHEENYMYEGIVTFVSGRGWFFAENLADHSGVFIHQQDVENQRYLRVDDRIQFDIVPSRKHPDKSQAANVKYLGRVIARQTSTQVSGGRQ
jgi:cold shock CspA family protein